ncbi:hypothetical protein [Hymenobacter sp. UYCo722]|uniref:hypothetical protein n=1 Tax=Hymenobacter sp. UYCo722 TaxID=3156335 RepID=UPI0033958439
MKHAYAWARPLLAALFLFSGFGASAQQAWRPFRPGLLYAFSAPGSSSAHMLRLDSVYRTPAGDSAWTFGRLLKTTDGHEQSTNPYGTYRKSRNNLFGARLIWHRASSAFLLENLAEGNFQVAVTLELRPQAVVGSSWTASTVPALTATLTSRSLQQVQGTADSVSVITLSSGQVVRLSRSYGLLEGPQWLGTSSAAPQWTQARLPQTLAQSPYNPLALFAMQPGDEMGYLVEPFTISPFPSYRSHILRRILTRQQTADSLVLTYKEQTRTENFGTPTGGMPGIQISPVSTRRWAFSLRTGRSTQYPAMGLLTGEYVPAAPNLPQLAGRGIVGYNGSGCGPSGQYLAYIMMFPGFGAPAGQFHTGIDIGWQQWFSVALGMGDVFTDDGQSLVYYRRSTGSPLTCGSPMDFINLLPTRAAQAAVATLAPNPVAEVATLTLMQPARPGTTLRLTDALGRTVWSAPVATGQTAVAVPLVEQPVGMYLLHLSGPEGLAASWKLNHE